MATAAGIPTHQAPRVIGGVAMGVWPPTGALGRGTRRKAADPGKAGFCGLAAQGRRCLVRSREIARRVGKDSGIQKEKQKTMGGKQHKNVVRVVAMVPHHSKGKRQLLSLSRGNRQDLASSPLHQPHLPPLPGISCSPLQVLSSPCTVNSCSSFSPQIRISPPPGSLPQFPRLDLVLFCWLSLTTRRKWQPIPVLLPGKSYGRRSLVVYSPWGRKESDTTERLHFL